MKSWTVNFSCSLILSAHLLSGCSPTTQGPPPQPLTFTTTPALTDDLPLGTLADAIDEQSIALRKNPETIMRFGDQSISRGAYAGALEGVKKQIRSGATAQSVYNYIAANFDFMSVAGTDKPGEVLLTSYFEPLIPGSRVRTTRFSQALYRLPPDLLTIQLSAFSERFKDEQSLRARIDGKRIVPYFTRSEIDGTGVLAAKNLELCWVDPIDSFFLHIQGSGTVRLGDGTELHIVYSEKNGRKYDAIGRFLKPMLPKGRVTLQTIESYLRSASRAEQQKYMFMNPSYVFFSISNQRAITSIGAPATPGRTIAADGKVFPKGALSFISFQKPIFDSPDAIEPVRMTQTSRFVLDQDSGGAITGTGRVDLFWGRGAEAKQAAGVIQEPARVMYLIPKDR